MSDLEKLELVALKLARSVDQLVDIVSNNKKRIEKLENQWALENGIIDKHTMEQLND